jgi:hypothetical protein
MFSISASSSSSPQRIGRLDDDPGAPLIANSRDVIHRPQGVYSRCLRCLWPYQSQNQSTEDSPSPDLIDVRLITGVLDFYFNNDVLFPLTHLRSASPEICAIVDSWATNEIDKIFSNPPIPGMMQPPDSQNERSLPDLSQLQRAITILKNRPIFDIQSERAFKDFEFCLETASFSWFHYKQVAVSYLIAGVSNGVNKEKCFYAAFSSRCYKVGFAFIKIGEVPVSSVHPTHGTLIQSALEHMTDDDALKMTRKLLYENADPNQIGKDDGGSALHTAARNDLSEVARLLIQRGARVDLQNRLGRTPLFFAVEKLDVKTAIILVKYGADPEHQDNTGRTPMIIAQNVPRRRYPRHDDHVKMLLVLQQAEMLNNHPLLWSIFYKPINAVRAEIFQTA